MEEMVKLTLAVSIPVWAAIAAFAFVSAYYAGIAGIGVVFIIVIIVAIVWNRTLVEFSDRVYGRIPASQPQGSNEIRLRDIESKIDAISRKLKD